MEVDNNVSFSLFYCTLKGKLKSKIPVCELLKLPYRTGCAVVH